MQATESILGIPVFCLGKRHSLDTVRAWMVDAGPNARSIVFANPHSIVTSFRDPLFSSAMMEADMCLPDGIGVVLASRAQHGNIRSRITGMDFFSSVSRLCDQQGAASFFFLGATPQCLDRIKERLAADYPRVRWAGGFSPPFKDQFSQAENDQIVAAVNGSGADFLWVGMTAPKQEKWVHRNKGRLNVKCVGAIGAAFDFYAGNVKRAPVIAQRVGIEWLYRWLREPRRLMARNLVSMPKFLLMVLLWRISRR